MDYVFAWPVMLLLGLLGNLALTLRGELPESGRPRPIQWVRDHPWRTATAALGAFGGAGALHGFDQLHGGTAFVAGILGAQVLDVAMRAGERVISGAMGTTAGGGGAKGRGPSGSPGHSR
jgi:hypothetical protein